ncbi:hypothetical protein CPB84DRAFT_1748719 [Gymnopilus junonius]|uniref:DUF6533 domain-containing protein n=1 Tax=Gymnopilus junonius TaxID=109634 RepID=A0A9P5NLA6_GYMJU|nr:hypothetical protein CPB84DRAFT_1748719 [Gymnopilus junonius]
MENGLPATGKPNTLFLDAVGFMSFAAVAAQSWDLMVSFSDEVEYLWRGRFRFTKALYFSSRYGLLVMQTIYVYKAIAAQVALKVIEMILLIRVYALYNQSFKAKRLLLAVFIITTTLELIGGSMADLEVFVNSIGAGICQFLQNSCLAGQEDSADVVDVEGGCVLLGVMITYEIIRNIYFKNGNARGIGNAAFAWYLALFSIAGSRLILNMRKLAFKHRSMLRRGYGSESGASDDESVCLTSLHDI